MRNRWNHGGRGSKHPSWRTYQNRLKRRAARERLFGRICKYATSVLFFAVVVYGITGGLGEAVYRYDPVDSPLARSFSSSQGRGEPNRNTGPPDRSGGLLSTADVRSLLDEGALADLGRKVIPLERDGRRFEMTTTIDTSLQNYLVERLDRTNSRYVGIVVMDAETGRILALVGFDREDPSHNPCMDSRFPAASIFKIVTAAAAVETCGLGASSPLEYFGRKYTLYKSQLKRDRAGRGHRTTLRDSFAQSINPVFGRLGVHYLGKSRLEAYAEAFGFNRRFDLEIPMGQSTVSITDQPYHWAEIASGFNRKTTISPLHGAMIASAVLNQGRIVAPVLVERIEDEQGRVRYRSRSTLLRQAISPGASTVMNALMEETIASGTCRKTFRKADQDSVLSRLRIGGKTGSINSRTHDSRRYDWFVGFAEEKEGREKIVLSAVVVHEKFIGVKAREYARMTLKHYFGNFFAGLREEKVRDGAL